MWSYVYQKSEFYLQLEDDLIAKDDYMEFIVDQLTSVTETGFKIDRFKNFINTVSKAHGHRRWLIGQIGWRKSVRNSDSEWLLLNSLQNWKRRSFDQRPNNQNWTVFPTWLMTVHIDHSYRLKRPIIFILDDFDQNDRSVWFKTVQFCTNCSISSILTTRVKSRDLKNRLKISESPGWFWNSQKWVSSENFSNQKIFGSSSPTRFSFLKTNLSIGYFKISSKKKFVPLQMIQKSVANGLTCRFIKSFTGHNFVTWEPFHHWAEKFRNCSILNSFFWSALSFFGPSILWTVHFCQKLVILKKDHINRPKWKCFFEFWWLE